MTGIPEIVKEVSEPKQEKVPESKVVFPIELCDAIFKPL